MNGTVNRLGNRLVGLQTLDRGLYYTMVSLRFQTTSLLRCWWSLARRIPKKLPKVLHIAPQSIDVSLDHRDIDTHLVDSTLYARYLLHHPTPLVLGLLDQTEACFDRCEPYEQFFTNPLHIRELG
jgi:hypothetical protein